MAHYTTTDSHIGGLPFPITPGDTIKLTIDGLNHEWTFKSYNRKTGLVRYDTGNGVVDTGIASFYTKLERASVVEFRKS